jgi:hypothetical protein
MLAASASAVTKEKEKKLGVLRSVLQLLVTVNVASS